MNELAIVFGYRNREPIRVKRCLESLSKQPAKTIGWFATTPIVWPSNLIKPIRMFFAKFSCNSKKSYSSAIDTISSFISYGKFGFSGIKVSNAKEILFFGSLVFLFIYLYSLLDGKKLRNFLNTFKASISLLNDPSATEEIVVWVSAPPSSSAVTSSEVTVFTISGPVIYI